MITSQLQADCAPTLITIIALRLGAESAPLSRWRSRSSAQERDRRGEEREKRARRPILALGLLIFIASHAELILSRAHSTLGRAERKGDRNGQKIYLFFSQLLLPLLVGRQSGHSRQFLVCSLALHNGDSANGFRSCASRPELWVRVPLEAPPFFPLKSPLLNFFSPPNQIRRRANLQLELACFLCQLDYDTSVAWSRKKSINGKAIKLAPSSSARFMRHCGLFAPPFLSACAQRKSIQRSQRSHIIHNSAVKRKRKQRGRKKEKSCLRGGMFAG